MDIQNFEDIRPYTDLEVSEAISRLKKEPSFFKIMNWVFPDFNQRDILDMLEGVNSTDDFQVKISGPVFKVIAQRTTNGLTFSNLGRIKTDKPYLFLSNHRDIILDSSLLNMSLLERGYPTTQIAIGDNLLKNDMIYDLVRINKNFIVNRDINPREALLVSKRLSNYIRKTITEDKNSIWIAHKEGRSKDGDDRTASALLKMLNLSYEGKNIEKGLKELRIIPTVVSYEFDPTDLIKANELLTIKQTGNYEKEEKEDFYSMIKGVTGHKGRVNIAVGKLITKDLKAVKHISNKNKKLKELSALIDQKMHLLYQLWPNNYIAYDWLNGTSKYKEKYSSIQKISFKNYIRGKIVALWINRKKQGHPRDGFTKEVREILLKMYATPVANREKALESKLDVIL